MKIASQLESDNPGALVAVFDAYGYYLYASLNHKQAIGYGADELTTMHLSQVVQEAHHHAAYVLRTIVVFYTKPLKFSSHLVAKTGPVVKVTGTLRHLREQDIMYFITCVRPDPGPTSGQPASNVL